MEVGEEGEREIIYLSLHCHHHNDTCIKMRSDEILFQTPFNPLGALDVYDETAEVLLFTSLLNTLVRGTKPQSSGAV